MAEQGVDPFRETFEQFVFASRLGDIQGYAAHGFAIFRGDGRAEVSTQQAVTGAGTEEGEVSGDHLFEQALEIGFDLFLDAGFFIFGRADIERAATDDDCGVIVEVYIFGDAVVLDAYSVRVFSLQLAVLQEAGIFAVGGGILGA